MTTSANQNILSQHRFEFEGGNRVIQPNHRPPSKYSVSERVSAPSGGRRAVTASVRGEPLILTPAASRGRVGPDPSAKMWTDPARGPPAPSGCRALLEDEMPARAKRLHTSRPATWKAMSLEWFRIPGPKKADR